MLLGDTDTHFPSTTTSPVAKRTGRPGPSTSTWDLTGRHLLWHTLRIFRLARIHIDLTRHQIVAAIFLLYCVVPSRASTLQTTLDICSTALTFVTEILCETSRGSNQSPLQSIYPCHSLFRCLEEHQAPTTSQTCMQVVQTTALKHLCSTLLHISTAQIHNFLLL